MNDNNDIKGLLQELLEKINKQEQRLENLENSLRQQPFNKIQPEKVEYKKPTEQPVIQKPTVLKPQEKLVIKPTEKIKSNNSFELNLGKYIFQIIGVGLFVVGMIFLLKYSIDQGWISPLMRVLAATTAGIAFVVGAELLRKTEWALACLTGGITLLYLSVYGATNYYALISPSTGSILVATITALGGFFALHYNSQFIAFFSLFGGIYITHAIKIFNGPLIAALSSLFLPILSIQELISFDFFYLVALVVGFFTISYYKQWLILATATFWLMGINTIIVPGVGLVQIIIPATFFALFAGIAYLDSIVRKKITPKFWIVLDTLTLFIVSATLPRAITRYFSLDIQDIQLLKYGLFVFGGIYLCKALLMLYHNKKDIKFIGTLTTLSISLFTGVIVMRWQGYILASMLNFYAALLFVLSFILRFWLIRVLAYLVFVGALGRYVTLLFSPIADSYVYDSLIFNELNLATIILLGIFGGGLYLASRYKNELEKSELQILPVFELGIFGTIALWLHSPLWIFPYNVTIFTLFTLVAFFIGVYTNKIHLRACSYAFTLITLVHFAKELLTIGFNEYTLTQFNIVGCILFSVLGLIAYIAHRQLSKKESQEEYTFVTTIYTLLTTIIAFIVGRENITRSSLDSSIKPALLTVYHGVGSLVVIIIGFILRQNILRYFGILLAVSTLLLLGDIIWSLQNTLQRIGAFMAVGLIFILASFIYQRLSKRLE